SSRHDVPEAGDPVRSQGDGRVAVGRYQGCVISRVPPESERGSVRRSVPEPGCAVLTPRQYSLAVVGENDPRHWLAVKEQREGRGRRHVPGPQRPAIWGGCDAGAA